MKKVILWLLFLITAACAWEDNEDEYYNNHEHCGEHGELVDTQSDVNHCGQCNTICLANEACVGGACKCLNNNNGCGPTCSACLPNQDCVGGVCTGCPTGTICFDDLIGNGIVVPNGYANLNWTNFNVIDGIRAGNSYTKAVISPSNVIINDNAFNVFAQNDYFYPPSIISSSTPFTVESVYITCTTSPLCIAFISANNGPQITIPINNETPFLITFPSTFSNIQTLTFYTVIPSILITVETYPLAGFALDNLVIHF
jgi:hypothetical protein